MGLEIDRDRFEDEDYLRFAERLRSGLDALAEVMARPGFGAGEPTIGAELELCLVDDEGRALPINRAVLAGTSDPRLTFELDRFNLEVNARPTLLAGRPFAALEYELQSALAEIARAAAPHGARIAMVGILPTLRPADLSPEAVTDARRYHALSEGLRRVRRQRFHVRIEGEDTLDVEDDDVALQGATTSLQVHLRVAPRDFAAAYNAAQMATAPALAAATNAPTLLGQRLWEETRIALFRQLIDDRHEAVVEDWRPARVSFGHGWVREGAFELFAEAVSMHQPLLPVCGAEDPLACIHKGGVPALAELRMHVGTIWRWNRPVYDGSGNGHVRIELRALPSGPTVADMVANAAWILGLTLGLMPDARAHTCRMTFGQARRNFYEAARHGLDAELLWPSAEPPSPRPVRAADLVERLLPLAERGLVSAGVDASEAAAQLAIIADRVRRRTTGSRWQLRTLAEEEKRAPRAEAIAAMFARYRAEAETGRPVHTWCAPR
ncbi:Glutamate-cysteine ligase family protein [Minicystis rosea]|nr:Glutamate-cysteine ligase family protein [Minicystis rosea]